VPETIVVDHGKIYVSEHLTSVCARMGISIQPARLRTGRDKKWVSYCTSWCCCGVNSPGELAALAFGQPGVGGVGRVE